MSKAVIFLADGCEEVEALTIVDILRRGGVEILGVAIGGQLDIRGSHNIVFKADKLIDDVDFDEYDMVILPGGMGGRNNLLASEAVLNILDRYNSSHKLIAAICAAPTILGRLGILKGKNAVCYPGLEAELTGAELCDANVVIDDNIITSKGPATAMEFSLRLLDVLADKATADSVAEGLLF